MDDDERDDAEAEAVMHTWLGRGFVIDSIVEQDETNRLATARTHERGDSEGIVVDRPQRYNGIEVGARMTVLKLDGGLLIHSPVDIDPTEVEHLGDPRWVLAPNLLHHLYVGPWAEAGLEAWAAPRLPEKRSDVEFDAVVEEQSSPFGDEVELMPMRAFGMTNEVVVHHRPSRTLIVSDLVFNFTKSASWLTRAAMWCLCGYPGCQTTLLERFGMDRDTARREVEHLANWDFDRLIMAHGEVIETGGKSALLEAFGWAGVSAS
ncbi:MAG: hypothetical protein ACQEVA_12920 [Myxococcota bacterium]